LADIGSKNVAYFKDDPKRYLSSKQVLFVASFGLFRQFQVYIYVYL